MLEVDLPLSMQEISNRNEMVLLLQQDQGNALGSILHIGRVCRWPTVQVDGVLLWPIWHCLLLQHNEVLQISKIAKGELYPGSNWQHL